LIVANSHQSTKKKSAVRILSIEEARKLLHLVAAGFKVEADEREKNAWRERFGSLSLSVPPMDLAPIIAVGCFGGVRPEESARMTWDMVDSGGSISTFQRRSPRLANAGSSTCRTTSSNGC
jgi:hypothetical protein